MDRFVPNPRFEAEVLRSNLLLDDLKEAAENIADEAKRIAPEDEGDYIDGIEADSGHEDGKAIGRVNARDWKSNFIEFGTGDPAPTPAFAPLRRGAEGAGYDVRMEP